MIFHVSMQSLHESRRSCDNQPGNAEIIKAKSYIQRRDRAGQIFRLGSSANGSGDAQSLPWRSAIESG